MAEDISKYMLVQPTDLTNLPDAIYHEYSKASEYRVNFGELDPKRAEEKLELYHTLNSRPRSFDHLPVVDLNKINEKDLTKSLGGVLINRRSNRNFRNEPIRKSDLEILLQFSAGVNGRHEYKPNHYRNFRTYPSGGALYPIDIYIAVLNIKGVENGLYFHDPNKNILSRMKTGDVKDELYEAFIREKLVQQASCVIFLAAVFQRSRIKYEERAYRFVLLEAGHISQNFVLVANGIGVSAVPYGAFFDRKVESMLDLDGVEESIVHALVVGGLEE